MKLEISSFEYTELMREHFRHPRNVVYTEVEEWNRKASGRGAIGSMLMGDSLRIWIVVERDSAGEERITKLVWKSYGNPTVIAATSLMSEVVTENGGMTLEEALSLTAEDLCDRLGINRSAAGAIVSHLALRDAIHDYFRRSGQHHRIRERLPQIVCDCLGVTDQEIEEEVKNGAMDFDLLQQATGVGTGCGACHELVCRLIEEYLEKYFY